MFNVDPGDFPALVPTGGSLDLTDHKDSEFDQMEVKEGQRTPANHFWDKYKSCDTLRFEFFKRGQPADGEEGEVRGQSTDPQQAGNQIPYYHPPRPMIQVLFFIKIGPKLRDPKIVTIIY